MFFMHFGIYVQELFKYLKKRILSFAKIQLKLGIPHWNSNFEAITFVGYHTSRVAYRYFMTHGEGISSIRLHILTK